MSTVTLREYVEALFREKDKALNAALDAVKEENRKTEQAAEKRFDLLNELRQGVATKEQLIALDKVVAELKDRVGRVEAHSSGVSDTAKVIIAIVTVLVALLGVWVSTH